MFPKDTIEHFVLEKKNIMIKFNFVNTSMAQRDFPQIQPCNCVLSAF